MNTDEKEIITANHVSTNSPKEALKALHQVCTKTLDGFPVVTTIMLFSP
jgi:hypothetical protein